MDVFILGSCIGIAVGVGYTWWSFVRPLADEINARDLVERRQIRQQLYRAGVRREHLGTPYISPRPTEFERTMARITDEALDALADNDDWSKKAHLRSVS